jgi:hypothetical protein
MKDEFSVKVFNSSVENRVEKRRRELKASEMWAEMRFAQVVCNFAGRQVIFWRGRRVHGSFLREDF